ncbi:uncharacterized protein LOC123867182 [Maniola jurtina]|uniref:uncharacterized protein LOC123867182 n=1 Tax=Maniola jurtina TaxID=191418 RepID=UPI001E68EE82|nr:uncharacterized protein LOC123867182 [Maniola jurtina]
MSSSSEEELLDFAPPDIEDKKTSFENLLLPKSREKYKKTYEDFIKWKTEKKVNSFSENAFLAYFNDLSKDKRPSTLWCEYSKLKTTIRLKENVNIGDYANLSTFLKRKSQGFMPKKSKVLSGNNIETFIKEAPDEQYLLEKVILIFGVNGACRSNEMTALTINDIETYDNKMLVRVRGCSKNDRMFIVQDELLKVVQKYQKLRPVGIKSDRFFLNFKNGKCTKQVVGRHKIAAIPKRIATYLDLPDAESYTGHCLRRSSATLLASAGANVLTLKRHGGWLSDKIAERYIEESFGKKSKITIEINKATLKTTPSEPRPSTSSAVPFDELTTETSTSSTLNSSPSVQQVNLPDKSVQLSMANFTNCTVIFNMNN